MNEKQEVFHKGYCAAVIALSAFGASAFAAGSTPAGYIQENVEFETAHADLIEYIYQQTMQFQPSINLENYQFHVSDFETLCLSLYGTHPDLTVILPNQNFYSCSYNPMSGIAANVMPKYAYSREEATQRLERFYEMADYFLGFVNDDMDDFTKALILHDELAIHGEYIISKQLSDGTTVLSSDYSQMVEGWGRCETYTEVYAYLLAQNGIVPGVPKASLDVERVERGCLRQLDTLSWMSVNLQGCTACVEVREKDKKPEIMRLEPANIKAARDGVITDIRVRQGFTQIKKGSGVVKGQLLVSGVNQTGQGGTRFVRADADILAEYTEEKTLDLPAAFDYYSLTENKTDRKRLKCFWLELPLSLSFNRYEHTACTFREEALTIGGRSVPVSVSTETSCELAPRTVRLSQKQAETVFRRHILLTELFCQPQTQVVKRLVTVKKTKAGYSCTAICTNCENIAQTVEFSVTG